MAGIFQTRDEKIGILQSDIAKTKAELTVAEDKLSDRLADVSAFEQEFEARVGFMMDILARVEKEVDDYLERIRLRREHKVFGAGWTPVEEQFRQRWAKPSPMADEPLNSGKFEAEPEPEPVSPKEIKRMYRTLTKQYHPDLAEDDEDRAFRTEQMSKINEAYAAKDGSILKKLVDDLEANQFRKRTPTEPLLSKEEQIKKLQADLFKVQNRLHRIRRELRTLHNRSSVKLGLEAKLAKRSGRDLLEEMAADMKRKIQRKVVERDMLRSQFSEL